MKKLFMKILTYICFTLIFILVASYIGGKFTKTENAIKQSAINKAEEEYPGYKFECAGVAQNFETKTYSVAVRPTNFDIPTLVYYKVELATDGNYYALYTGGRNTSLFRIKRQH